MISVNNNATDKVSEERKDSMEGIEDLLQLTNLEADEEILEGPPTRIENT